MWSDHDRDKIQEKQRAELREQLRKSGLTQPSEIYAAGKIIPCVKPMKTRDYSAKYDQGKTNWSLLPWRAVERAAKIMTFAATPKNEGGKGYGVDSWKTVKGGMFRYWAALCRHTFCRFVLGEIIDPETGEPHMAHALCNVMFICGRDLECAAGEMTEEEKESWYERDV